VAFRVGTGQLVQNVDVHSVMTTTERGHSVETGALGGEGWQTRVGTKQDGEEVGDVA